MTARRIERVQFAAGQSRTGPLTWAQTAGWNRFQREGSVPPTFALAGVLPTAGQTIDVVVDCARRIVERHEALRTRFLVPAGGGRPRQEVLDRGRFDVHVMESPTDDPARTLRRGDLLAAELKPYAADVTRDWLTQFGVLTWRGEPICLVVALSHFLVDKVGMDVVTADLSAMLTGAPLAEPPPGRWTPMRLAEYEHSPDGRRVNARAVTHWERFFRSAPPTMFPAQRGSEPEPICAEITMESAALQVAVSRVAARHRVSDLAVLLTATCLALRSYSNTGTCALELIAANRSRVEAHDAVCHLVMHSPFLIDLGDATYEALLPRVAAAALGSYRYSHHDPIALDTLSARVSRERGVPVERSCLVNHIPLDTPAPAAAVTVDPRDLLARTRFQEASRRPWSKTKFRLTMMDMGDTRRLQLAADTGYLRTDDMVETLRLLEATVVEAAVDERAAVRRSSFATTNLV